MPKNDRAEQAAADIINKVTDLIKSDRLSAVSREEWHQTYKKLKSIKSLFDPNNKLTWEQIIKESGETWIKGVRQDEVFKEYYKLRKEFDKINILRG